MLAATPSDTSIDNKLLLITTSSVLVGTCPQSHIPEAPQKGIRKGTDVQVSEYATELAKIAENSTPNRNSLRRKAEKMPVNRRNIYCNELFMVYLLIGKTPFFKGGQNPKNILPTLPGLVNHISVNNLGKIILKSVL
jgi:hypothetical protein